MIRDWTEQAPTTTPQIQTIGYAEKGAEERIAAFLAQKNTLLLDIRKDPLSRWRPTFRRGALTMQYGAQYRWFPEFGNLNHKAADRHKGIAIANPQAGLVRVLRLLESEHTLLLMCACKDYKSCHRKVVYELIMKEIANV